VVTGARRDAAQLAEGLARWVATAPDQVRAMGPGSECGRLGVESVTHADGGMANETLLVDLGPEHPGVVVRLPPVDPTFPDYDLAPQATVHNAVAAHGVPAPAPAMAVEDPQWIGCPFLVMPRVRGNIPGPAPLFDPYVGSLETDARRRLHLALVHTVAAVHAVPWAAEGLGAVLSGTSIRDALDAWSDYVAWAADGEPLPVLAEALAWCGSTCPSEASDDGPVLLWGDVRLGNLVMGPDQEVVAVLDWDLAAIGPPEMDLGWLLGLDAMMASLFGETVPGFLSRGEVVSRYEEATGHVLRHLDWHEVFALVRALAINDRHQRITGSPRRAENPMGAVLRERMAAAGEALE
jgi:aminoglycoside phosphotransferase (APT) family kinase protein